MSSYFSFGLLLLLISFVFAEKCLEKKPVFCYWSSWSVYRPGNGTYRIGHIIPEYCTHIIYTFAGINLSGDIDSLDYNNDITNGGYKNFVNIKEIYPCVKILLAIGGWNEGSEKYSLMAETEETRKKFVDKVLRYLIYFGFDGLDVDWEYPTKRGGLLNDRENFVSLLELLKTRLSFRNRVLTAAVPASLLITKNAYDVRKICSILDFVLIMGYDLHTPNFTSIHSRLSLENEESTDLDTLNELIQYYKRNGCKSEKIILGIPAFGRSYTLKNSNQTEVGAQAIGVGKSGPYTKEPGFLGYNEICEYQKTQNGWKTIHLKQNAAVYSWNNKFWVSYDDPDSISLKADYVLKENLGGLMLWSIDTDDFHGICSSEAYPLLTAINKGLGNTIFDDEKKQD